MTSQLPSSPESDIKVGESGDLDVNISLENDPLVENGEDIFKYLEEAKETYREEFSDSEIEEDGYIETEEDENSQDEQTDPLFDPKEERNSLFPLKYLKKDKNGRDDLWDMAMKATGCFWVPEDIDLIGDLSDWEKLDENQRHFIKLILAFFSGFDKIVNDNLEGQYVENVKIPEAKTFLHFQQTMEDIHQRSYALMIETYIKDQKEKDQLLNAVDQIPVVKAIADWAKKWIKTGGFVERILVYAFIEGVIFSGAFCGIFWLKKQGKMQGFTMSNELISRDEGLHYEFGCLCYNTYIINKLPPGKVQQIAQEGLELTKKFVSEALKVKLIGMNVEMMTQYLEFITDRYLLNMIGFRKYNVSNPFPWMDMISLQVLTNFFENRVSNYGKKTATSNPTDNQIRFDESF